MTEQYDPEEAPRTENDVEKMDERRGLPRRTILTGAAWAVPTIVLVTATPAAAVSVTPTLTFTNGPYTTDACSLITPTLQATTDGTTPAVGELVMVTPPDGFTWSDGSTATRTFTTNGSGQVTLDGLQSVYYDDTFTLTANSSSGATASTSITVDADGAAYQYIQTGAVTFQVPNVPSGSEAVGGGFYLAPDGTLYVNSGAIVAVDVDFALGQFDAVSSSYVSYTKAGVAYQYNLLTNTTFLVPVPAGTTPVGGGYWLATNGDLFFNNGGLVATGVDEAVGEYTSQTSSFVSYTRSGVAYQYNVAGGGGTNSAPPLPVPTGSTPVGGGFWLAANGNLYFNNGGLVATGVDEAVGSYDPVSGSYVSYRKNGVAHQYVVAGGGGTNSAPALAVPSGSTPIGGGFWLSPTGDVYTNTGAFVAGNVISAVGGFTAASGAFVGYVTSGC